MNLRCRQLIAFYSYNKNVYILFIPKREYETILTIKYVINTSQGSTDLGGGNPGMLLDTVRRDLFHSPVFAKYLEMYVCTYIQLEIILAIIFETIPITYFKLFSLSLPL